MIATTFDGIVVIPSGCDVLAVSVTVSQRIVVITGGLRGAISAGLRVGLAAFRTLTRINLRAWWTRLLWYHLWALLPSCCDVVTIGLTVSLRIVAITGGLRGAASAGLRVSLAAFRTLTRIILRAWTRLLWYHLWALLPSGCDVLTVGLTVCLRIVAITGGLRGAASAGLRVCCVNPRIARKIKRSISCVKLGAVKLDKRKIEERYSTYECRCRMGGGGEICARRNTGGGIRYGRDHSLGAILSAVPLRVRAPPVIMLLRLISPLASLPLTASSVVLALGGDFFFWRFGGMVDLAGDGRAERELELDMFSSKWSRLNLLEAGEEGAVVQFRRTSKKRQ